MKKKTIECQTALSTKKSNVVAMRLWLCWLHALMMLLFCVCTALLIQILPTPGHLEIQQSSRNRLRARSECHSFQQLRAILTAFGVPDQILCIDWCCFYYFGRNSLVALAGSSMCLNLFFRFVNISFFLTFFFVCVQGLQQSLSSAPLNQAPVPGCRHSSSVLIVHVCLCVCTSVCAYENV